MDDSVFKSGFVAVLGWTNVGKSTLLNRLVGQKINITAPKSQTTRFSTTAILTEDRGQIIFLDTPGFHRPRHLLNRMMIRESSATLERSDLAVHIISPDVDSEEKMLEDLLKGFKKSKILAFNKIDLLKKAELLQTMDNLARKKMYDEIIPISARTGENLDRLLTICFSYLPEGPKFYPEEHLSDRQERFFMAELIREKVILLTRQELPHATAVLIDDAKIEKDKKIWRIKANIVVEKDSQKGIIIGSGGRKLKEIGRQARLELEAFLGHRVFLELWVKVRKNWTRDQNFLREIGYTQRG